MVTMRSQSPRKGAMTPQLIVKKTTMANKYLMQRKATLGNALVRMNSSFNQNTLSPNI